MSSSRTYFESLGKRWNRLRAGFFTDAVRNEALATAGVVAGQTAVDVGAGTGFLTTALLTRGLRVVAVDEAPAMLDALREGLDRPDAVDCRVGTADALPIASGTLDHCFANMLLHHVEDPPAVLHEMARVLRPGGRVVLTDLDSHDFAFLREEHHDRWLGFARADVQCWLEDAGFTAVRVDGMGEDCRATSTSGMAAAIGIFVASGTR